MTEILRTPEAKGQPDFTRSVGPALNLVSILLRFHWIPELDPATWRPTYMAESSYLAGRVRKRGLPVVHGSSEPNEDTIKRLLLPQGELAQFYDSDQPVHYIAYIELRENGVRGNHYHKLKDEWVYLIAGEVVVGIEDVQTKTRESVTLQTGDRVFIPAGIAHAFRTVKAGLAVEFSPARFNLGDIHRYPLS